MGVALALVCLLAAPVGVVLAQDADACRETRADTAAILKVENI